jgi:hypothetical protein
MKAKNEREEKQKNANVIFFLLFSQGFSRQILFDRNNIFRPYIKKIL